MNRLFLIALLMVAACSDSGTSSSTKIIFVTASAFNGNLGGVSGADSKCNSDVNKPNGSTYKAMLTDGSARIACTSANCGTSGVAEHVDWVLKTSTTYQRPDGTEIGTTNALGLLIPPLSNTYALAVGTNEAARVWVGWATNWTATNHCTAWSNSGGVGSHARQDAIDSDAINYSQQLCIDTNSLACVEQ